MTDHTQLRKLATEALLDHEIRHSFTIDHSGWSGASDLIEAQEFIAAANPKAVLELLDENERLKKDAERLNWIQRNLFGHQWNGVIDPGSRTQWSIWTGYRNITINMIGDTFRAAIDAASSKMESTAVKQE